MTLTATTILGAKVSICLSSIAKLKIRVHEMIRGYIITCILGLKS